MKTRPIQQRVKVHVARLKLACKLISIIPPSKIKTLFQYSIIMNITYEYYLVVLRHFNVSKRTKLVCNEIAVVPLMVCDRRTYYGCNIIVPKAAVETILITFYKK